MKYAKYELLHQTDTVEIRL